MKVYLSEIGTEDSEFDFTEKEAWLAKAVQEADEEKETKKRGIEAHLSLQKVDEVVVITGKLDTTIKLLCSRCAAPFILPCDFEFKSLYSQDKALAGLEHNHGKARHAHDFAADEEIDLDITYLKTEYIELGDVVTEQLRLQIPFQPLCKDDCKGICTNCGTDLNKGRCACSKIKKSNPFSALGKLKF
jgi:uncharacterized protein